MTTARGLKIFWIVAISAIVLWVYSKYVDSQEYEKANPIVSSTPAAPTLSAYDAERELNDLIKLCKKGDIIRKYDLTIGTFYAGRGWYLTEASVKKDLIAKFGLLKKAITGYTNLEVHDAYNDQKVGEITAFSQSIEIYK